MAIRSFSSQFEDTTANCDVDNDAPRGLRQEWVDALYLVLSGSRAMLIGERNPN